MSRTWLNRLSASKRLSSPAAKACPNVNEPTVRSESKKSATARDFLYIQQPPKLKTVAENNGVEDTGVLLKTQMF